MSKFPLIFLVFTIGLSSQILAQTPSTPFVDIHLSSSKKPFNSRGSVIEYNLWETIDHSCESSRAISIIQTLGNQSPKSSQANFEAMAKGNNRLACLNISPIEQQFITANNTLNNKNKKATVACAYGIMADQLFLRSKEVNYFTNLINHVNYLQKYESSPYYINGYPFKYKLLRNQKDLLEIEQENTTIGLALTVGGGHALGHSIYINDDITDLEEYQSLILENVDILKGIRPISKISDQMLEIPILWLSLANNFQNGMGGNANSLKKELQNIFSKSTVLNDRETKLGIAVIDRLIDKDKGRRILIDIKHMSLNFRNRYYKTVDRLSILGDPIPIVCSHCAVSGLSKKSSLYKKRDEDTKNNNSYLNHWKQNLSEEDVLKIYNSRGLLGISLDKSILAGQLALNEISATLPNSLQRRKACVKVLLANVFTAVQIINKKNAWGMIAIGSDFDEMLHPLDPYKNSSHLIDLSNDIQRFLERPEDIQDIFTVKEIQDLMFDYSPAEITEKIMSLNALNFIQRHFPVK